MRVRIRRAFCFLLLAALCLTASGCRVRTGGPGAGSERDGTTGETGSYEAGEQDREDEAPQESDPGGRTREDPGAERKEYDENAPAEIVPGAEQKVHGEGEGEGAFEEDPDAAASADRVDDAAEDAATRTVAAGEADRMGVSEDAEEADSALLYYTVLLKERTGSLYECQRRSVYWETALDHVTIFKSSPEHELILGSGAYDVSARLLEENLRVDDGWISRKDPEVIVKAVPSSVLGSGVTAADAARRVWTELQAREGWQAISAVRSGRVLLISEELLQAPWSRTVAMLVIARAADPDIMADVDPDEALEMLSREATGAPTAGLFYYDGRGGN